MSSGKKTDNANLASKLALRRHFLDKYHADGQAAVLDCCQGGGVLWSHLREEFAVKSYWGIDVKAKPGRLKLDSVRVLAQPGWPQDCVDINTYGSPWKHWQALLPNVGKRAVTVFLTIGQWSMGTDKALLAALGLGDLAVPPGIAIKLHEMALWYMLALAGRHGLAIAEIRESPPSLTARYLGLRLAPSS